MTEIGKYFKEKLSVFWSCIQGKYEIGHMGQLVFLLHTQAQSDSSWPTGTLQIRTFGTMDSQGWLFQNPPRSNSDWGIFCTCLVLELLSPYFLQIDSELWDVFWDKVEIVWNSCRRNWGLEVNATQYAVLQCFCFGGKFAYSICNLQLWFCIH